MREVELVSSLIADIYDAALDVTLWSAVLGKTRSFVGGSTSALYSKDAISKSGRLHYQEGDIDWHYRKLYIEKYAKLDPFTTLHFFAEIEQPIGIADLMPYNECGALQYQVQPLAGRVAISGSHNC